MDLLTSVFLKILNMSITGSYVIIGVLLIRLLLRRVPKIFSYALWGVVAFRLLCPVSFSSPISIFSLKLFDMTKAQNGGAQALTYIPSDIGLQQVPKVTIGIPTANTFISSSLPAASPAASANPMQIWILAAAVLWCIGFAALMVFFLYSNIRVRKQLDGAVLFEKNIFECGKIQSPFVFGFFRPKIYIPFRMERGVLENILAHEQCHIKRRDYIIKPLAFVLLAVYWFNPLAWAAFFLMCRDMEMSCDEKVLRGMNASGKKDYSMSLLSMASVHYLPAAGPLAFGESDVKSRVKNILSFKRPGIWVIIAALILSAGTIIVLESNPNLTGKAETDEKQITQEDLYGRYVFDENIYTTPISSYFPPSKGILLYYEISADSLVIIDKEQDTIKEYPALYEKKVVDENTFAAAFSDIAVVPDISKYKDCYQYAVFTTGDTLEYKLYVMDDEVWIVSFNGEDNWLWSVYGIIPSEDTGTSLLADENSENEKLQVEASSQDLSLEKTNNGVRIFSDSYYLDYTINTNNTELDYDVYKFFLQDMVSKEGVRYILFSYNTVTVGRGMGIQYNYLLISCENNQLIPLWTNEDITFDTSYDDNVFSVKIGDSPEAYKIDIASKVEYENQFAEKFKPLSVEDVFNGSTSVVCYDVKMNSENQIVTQFLCNNSDYLFYITSIKLVWSLQNGEIQLDACSLVNEIPD